MTFHEVTIGDYFDVKHGYAFKGEYFTDSGPYIVVTPGNFFESGGFRLREGKEKFYVGEFPKNFLLEKDDLIIAMTQQGPGLLGSSAMVPEDNQFLHNQRIGLVTNLDESKLCKRFLYYLLNTRPVRGQIEGSATGSKVKHTAPKRIKAVRVKIPSLTTQNRIASILTAYDKLFGNNRRRIALLEEAAQQLYKEWFVRLRFPEYESTKIVDCLPDGWNRDSLIANCHLLMGQSPRSEFYNDRGEGLPFHQGVTNFGDRFVTHETYCTIKNRVAESGDILFSVRAPVGRLNLATDQLVIGRGVAAIRNRKEFQSFQYYQLKSHFYKEDLIGSGSIFASVTKKQLESQEMIVPPDAILNAFERISRPIDEQIKNLHQQNVFLTDARDMLLPRLMNGEITI